jgi:DNA-binding NarL/FixJ family response regulator
MTELIRVGVATSDVAFGAALCTFLGSAETVDVSGPLPSAHPLADLSDLDVAVVDLRLPGAIATVERLAGSTATLVLGATDPEAMIGAFDAGASSYVDEEATFEEIAEAVQHLVQGHAIVPPPLLGALLKHVIRRHRAEREAREQLGVLTPREREVFDLVATGADNATVAQQLYISPATARTHVQRVFKKLDLHSRAEAVAFAIRCGLYPGGER